MHECELRVSLIVPSGQSVCTCRRPLFTDIDLTAGLNYITADNAKAGQLAAEHLLKRGFRRFGCTGHGNLFWSRERCESFTRTISKAGFKILSYDSVQKRNINWEKELVNLARWVKSLPKPIGLMACNDDWGQNIIEACNIAGVHVPEEVAVIGVDNDDLVCDLVNPPLTSVAVNFEGAGYEVPRLLDAVAVELIYHARTGERLLSDDPWTCTRCHEQSVGCQTHVGGFRAEAGLLVDYDIVDVNSYIGLAPLRKF